MKWLKSTTQKAWTVEGLVIPACVTPHNSYLAIEDDVFGKISAIPVIKSLIAANGILVLSEEPTELKNSVSALQGNNAALTAQITQLQEQLKERDEKLAAVDVEKIKSDAQAEIKAQAVAELEEKEARIKELEAQLAAKSTKSTK